MFAYLLFLQPWRRLELDLEFNSSFHFYNVRAHVVCANASLDRSCSADVLQVELEPNWLQSSNIPRVAFLPFLVQYTSKLFLVGRSFLSQLPKTLSPEFCGFWIGNLGA